MGRLPESAGADPGLSRRDNVDQRTVCCHAIDPHLEPRCATNDPGKTDPVPGNACRYQTRREPGERAFDHSGKDIVSSGRQWQKWDFTATLCDDAVRAVSAQG